MKAFGVRPKRDLGQNFLIDSNLLDVIARAAELGPDDVVLEVGGGLGVLSEYLASRVAHVHVVEIDRRLEPALRDALDPFANATLHPGVAVQVAMVQREVGERLAARPGTAAYGAPSVLAQLAGDVRVVRPVSRNV